MGSWNRILDTLSVIHRFTTIASAVRGRSWRGFATGSRLLAAAAGGFTAVACMANTVPANDSRSITEHFLLEAQRAGFARVHPIGAVTKGLEGQELTEMGELVRAGAVAVSDDGKPVMNAELMRRALQYARHTASRSSSTPRT